MKKGWEELPKPCPYWFLIRFFLKSKGGGRSSPNHFLINLFLGAYWKGKAGREELPTAFLVLVFSKSFIFVKSVCSKPLFLMNSIITGQHWQNQSVSSKFRKRFRICIPSLVIVTLWDEVWFSSEMVDRPEYYYPGSAVSEARLQFKHLFCIFVHLLKFNNFTGRD